MIEGSNPPHSSLPVSPDAATRLGLGWPWWWRSYDFSKRRLRVLDWVDPDDGDATIFRNVGNSLPVDVASHVSSAASIWEPQISYRAAVLGFPYLGHVACHSSYRAPRVKQCLNIEQSISYLTQHKIWFECCHNMLLVPSCFSFHGPCSLERRTIVSPVIL
jgi:hypothetical protein